MNTTLEDPHKDVRAGVWLCEHCQQQRDGIRRLNAIGSGAVGALFPFCGLVFGSVYQIAEKQAPAHALSVSFGALLIAMSILMAVANGPGRSLTCATCERAELVPINSKRAERLLLIWTEEGERLQRSLDTNRTTPILPPPQNPFSVLSSGKSAVASCDSTPAGGAVRPPADKYPEGLRLHEALECPAGAETPDSTLRPSGSFNVPGDAVRGTLRSMSTDNRAKDASEKIGALVASGAAGGASAAVAGSAAGVAVFFALFPAAVGLTIWAGFEWRKERAAHWWKAIVDSGWESPDEVQGLLEAHQNQAWARETVLESVRRLLESVDDASAMPLGSLTAEYMREKSAPDFFFRGFARVLADVDRDQLLELKGLVEFGLCLEDHGKCGTIARAKGELILRQGFVPAPGEVLIPTTDVPGAAEKSIKMPSGRSFLRLSHLLKIHGLADDGTAGYLDSTTGPASLVFDPSMWKRIHKHIASI